MPEVPLAPRKHKQMIDYPSDIRSEHVAGKSGAELTAWCKEIEAQYPYPGPCWNCGLTETHVILPDRGEIRCYCGVINARMINGELEKVREVWDNDQ